MQERLRRTFVASFVGNSVEKGAVRRHTSFHTIGGMVNQVHRTGKPEESPSFDEILDSIRALETEIRSMPADDSHTGLSPVALRP